MLKFLYFHANSILVSDKQPILNRVFVADQEYWYEQARIALRKRLQYATDRRPHAKNVLLFVGDGMGVSTATAARILRGQRLGKLGEEHELAWDAFPTVALAKVRGWNEILGPSISLWRPLQLIVLRIDVYFIAPFRYILTSFSAQVYSLLPV